MRKPVVRSMLLALVVLITLVLAGAGSGNATVTCPIEYYPIRTCVYTPEDGLGVLVYPDGQFARPWGVLVTCYGGPYQLWVRLPGSDLREPLGIVPVPCLL